MESSTWLSMLREEIQVGYRRSLFSEARSAKTVLAMNVVERWMPLQAAR